MTKVQLFKSLSSLALILSIVGCERTPEDTPDTHDRGRFGSGYEILTNETSAAPDEPPAIVSDTLKALVSYPGGCEDHEFEIDSEVRRDTSRLWLRHDAGGDDCEAMITDRLELPVSSDVLEANTILLLNPNADVPFVLRWGETAARPPSGESPD